MEPHSSTSNFELTIEFIPLPTLAAWIALTVVVLIGSALSAVSGYHGSLLREAFPNIRREAFRYNQINGQHPAQVLLLGTSRMRHGIIEEQLAAELGPDWQAINLGLDSAGLWEIYCLVKELDPPKGTGQKLAVIEAHPSEFLLEPGAKNNSRPSFMGGYRGIWKRFVDQWPVRQSIVIWMPEIYYGWFAGDFPQMVSVPPPLPRLLWTVDAEARRRAVSNMQPETMASLIANMRFDEREVGILQMIVAELQSKAFRVILLEPPSHSSYVAALDDTSAQALASAYRELVLNPEVTGADATIELRDADAIDADDDDFFDYSHLNEEGAKLETSKVAEFLQKKIISETR